MVLQLSVLFFKMFKTQFPATFERILMTFSWNFDKVLISLFTIDISEEKSVHEDIITLCLYVLIHVINVLETDSLIL